MQVAYVITQTNMKKLHIKKFNTLKNTQNVRCQIIFQSQITVQLYTEKKKKYADLCRASECMKTFTYKLSDLKHGSAEQNIILRIARSKVGRWL